MSQKTKAKDKRMKPIDMAKEKYIALLRPEQHLEILEKYGFSSPTDVNETYQEIKWRKDTKLKGGK
jgi:hypothetical protein